VTSLPGCPAVGRSWWNWRISLFSPSSFGTAIRSLTVHSRRFGTVVEGSSWASRFAFHWSTSSRSRSCAWAIFRSRSIHSASGSVRSLMKSSLSMSVTFSLSVSPWSACGGRDRRSAAWCSFPGTCLIRRLYSCSSENQRATLRFTFLGAFQKVRLAWSVSTRTGISVPARCGLQCARAFMTARSSLS
jgi:hypothetical protein